MDRGDADLRRIAYLAILLFGLISFSGDLIYEGARSIIPVYLYMLGASAFIVGLTGGLGEFLGYGLRLLSGYLADTTRAYWKFTILGYLLLISIPLLALAGSWQIAIILILIERLAKAVRSPARDTLLSSITQKIGLGKAFGLHELMDQIGAIGGPLIVTMVLYITSNSFTHAFMSLLIPYMILVLTLSLAYLKLKSYTIQIQDKVGSYKSSSYSIPRPLKWYILSVTINTMGLIHISLILYKVAPKMIPWAIPILYLIAQGVDAVIAPLAGLLFDKYGRRVLYVPFALSVIPPILTFIGGVLNIIMAIVVFGMIYGMQESIYRAAIAQMSPINIRGLAYGLFYTAYGFGFFISGLVYGFLLDINYLSLAIAYAIVSQVIAISALRLSLT